MTIATSTTPRRTTARVVVKLYAMPMCTQSAETFDALQRAGVKFEYVDISRDPVAQEEMAQLECYQTPLVTAVIHGQTRAWVGHSPVRIKALAREIAAAGHHS